MAERRDDEQLTRALRALGGQIDYPPTPDLATAVRARLVGGAPRRRASWRGWFAAPGMRRLALALVVLVALVGGVLAFSPGAREAIAGRLGVRGITIEYATPTPSARPTPMPVVDTRVPVTPTTATAPTARPTGTLTAAGTPSPASVGERLRLGERLTIEEVRSRVAFPLLLPTLPTLGEVNEVYLGAPPHGGQVALVWLPRLDLPAAAETGVGVLFTQFKADLDPGFIKKIISAKTTVQFVGVNSGQGYWIEGEPHEFLYQIGRDVFVERMRLAGNVLLWEVGGVTYRIEGPRTLDEALRIAYSLR